MVELKNFQFYTSEENAVLENCSPENLFLDIKRTHQSSVCTCHFQNIDFDNIGIHRFKFDLEKDFHSSFEIQKECILLCFSIEGQITLNTSSHSNLNFYLGTQNIIYTPAVQGSLFSAKGTHDFFYIELPIELFKEYLPLHTSLFNNFKEKIQQEKFSLLRAEPGIINHQFYRIIQEICQCKRQEEVKKLFIKAKVIELVSLQLEQFCSICSPVSALNKETLEKMYAVKDFILEHLGEYHSLKSLAYQVGTNEFTLKKEFKELFGYTVFGFWNEAKMEKAQQLLVQNKISIKEISEIIGYKNPQHFSTAFKRKFKISPSIYRKINIK